MCRGDRLGRRIYVDRANAPVAQTTTRATWRFARPPEWVNHLVTAPVCRRFETASQHLQPSRTVNLTGMTSVTAAVLRCCHTVRRGDGLRGPWSWQRIVLVCMVVIAATGAAIVAAAHAPGLFGPLAGWSGYRKDFTAFYTASSMLASGSGGAIYRTDVIARYETQFAGHPVGDAGFMGYLNLPFFAAALTPLTLLSLERAYQVWTALCAALLAVDVWMLWRLAASLPRRTRIVLAVGFLTFLPVADGLLLGQVSLILLTGWMAAFLLMRSGHDAWAGVALTALLLKPELLLPLLLLLAIKRRWHVLLGFAPFAACAVLASIPLVGLEATARYPAYVLSSANWPANAAGANAMFDWNGIVAMVWHQPAAVPAARLVVAVLSLASIVGLCYAWRGRFAPQSRRFAPQWMALTVVTVLVDPHLYLQDSVLLALPAIALFIDAPLRDRALVGWMLAVAWAIVALGPLPNERLHVNLFALYLVVAAAVVMHRLVGRWPRSREGERAPVPLAA